VPPWVNSARSKYCRPGPNPNSFVFFFCAQRWVSPGFFSSFQVRRKNDSPPASFSPPRMLRTPPAGTGGRPPANRDRGVPRKQFPRVPRTRPAGAPEGRRKGKDAGSFPQIANRRLRGQERQAPLQHQNARQRCRSRLTLLWAVRYSQPTVAPDPQATAQRPYHLLSRTAWNSIDITTGPPLDVRANGRCSVLRPPGPTARPKQPVPLHASSQRSWPPHLAGLDCARARAVQAHEMHTH